MTTPFVLAVPSKGRLQENAEAFFARAGLALANENLVAAQDERRRDEAECFVFPAVLGRISHIPVQFRRRPARIGAESGASRPR